MNPDQLRAYKIQKSRAFNAKSRELRLRDKEKKQTADQQGNLQGNQPDDNLTLQDLMDIYETLDTKMDIIQNKLETIIENKLDLIDNKLETIIDNKLETNQPINRQPSIFFA